MSGFLPYGGGGRGLWTGSFVFSISAHGGMVAALVALYTSAAPPPELEARTAFTVTVEQLDASALDSTIPDEPPEIEPEEPDQAEIAALDQTEPEPLEPVQPEEPDPEEITAEDLPPEEAETLEPEQPEDLVAEEPDALVPEEVETVDVETAEGPAASEAAQPVEVETAEGVAGIDPAGPLDGVVPDGAVAVAVDEGSAALAGTVVDSVAPATPISSVAEASPIASVAELSPLAPDIASPVAGGGGLAPVVGAGPATIGAIGPEAGTLAPVSPVGDAPQSVAALGSAQTPAPDPTPVSAPAEPTAQDRALGALITRIRATTPEENCLIALPRRDGDEGVGLALISASETGMEAYAQALLTADDADIRQTRTLIDPRQCAALSYVRATSDYPATAMGISADRTVIPSGESFTGVLRGSAGRFLSVLVIDDNGVVQDMQRFMSFSGNLARFDVPVNRVGPERDTQALLLAIATSRPPQEIKDRVGRLAADVFAGLPSDLVLDAALAITPFDVR